MKVLIAAVAASLFVGGCATFISKEEQLAATDRLMKASVHAAATQNKEQLEGAFAGHKEKYGEEMYVHCGNDQNEICTYKLYEVKQTAEWDMFHQVELCKEYLRDRKLEASNSGLDGFQRCTTEYFSPFSKFNSLKVDLSPITKVFDAAERNENSLRAKESAAELQKQKDEEAQTAAAEAADAKREAEALAFSKTPAGKLKAACDAYKETDGLLNARKNNKQALMEQGLSERQTAGALSGHDSALTIYANQANEYKRQYKQMTGKEINWKKDCK